WEARCALSAASHRRNSAAGRLALAPRTGRRPSEVLRRHSQIEREAYGRDRDLDLALPFALGREQPLSRTWPARASRVPRPSRRCWAAMDSPRAGDYGHLVRAVVRSHSGRVADVARI